MAKLFFFYARRKICKEHLYLMSAEKVMVLALKPRMGFTLNSQGWQPLEK
jgi:hypothetical protein